MHVSFHIWQRSDGSGNLSDTPANRLRLEGIIEQVNGFYSNNPPQGIEPSYSTLELNGSRIRVVLDDIYFYTDPTQDSSFYYAGTGSQAYTHNIFLDNWIDQNYPERNRSLNLHLTGGNWSGVGGYSHSGSILSFYRTNPDMNTSNAHDWWYGEHLTHELGHSLDLWHTYDVGWQQNCTISNTDFLWDVYDTTVNCSSSCEVCLIPASNPDNNNIMGGRQSNYISALQMGIIHRATSLQNFHNIHLGDNYLVRDFVTGYSNSKYEVNQDETWDFSVKFYQDILVKSGNTLTIKCEVQFVPQAKVIVEPGAKLIIDGGVLTNENYYRDFWQGIEVHGNYQLRQNTSNQGVVEVINDGIIEYARNGIRTIGLNESGTFDWSKTGGIVRINGGVFKDCRRGIEFMSYHNLTPTGNESSNVSYIFNTEFITTDEYLENQFPYAGITMYDVTGVRVRNTIFENQKTDLSSINNTNRGSGIISVDANYNATSGYNWQTGAPIAGTENEFRNLYYGVMTYGVTGRSDVKINDNLFEKCIYGVGLMGCNYGIIGRNQFNLLEFNNDPLDSLGPIGFGVYTDGAYGFNIEGNDFDILGASTNVNHHAVNVRNSSNNTSSGKVYRNNVDNIYLGTQTIGNNTALKIDCNDYQKGQFSTVDFNHADGDLADQGDCVWGVPVNNSFNGICNSTTLSQLFKSPSANPFVYSSQTGTIDPTCHNLGANVVICLGSDPNECLVTLANNAITVVDQRIALWKSKLGGTKETLTSVREILAYGDREELITIIENESNGLSKDTLLEASPYLSDRILIDYLTQSDTPPLGHIKEVLLANSPLTDSVLAVLNELSLPAGIMNQINLAQTGISERRLLEASESYLNTNRLVYIDAIVQEYLDTNWVDSAAVFLREEGSVEALCALVPIEVRRNDTIRANTIIDTLRTVASEMESNSLSCERACELNEFCDFQQFAFRIALRQGGYFTISSDERNILEQIATSDARVAVNAKAILHFIDETLPAYKGMELVFPKSMNSDKEVNELLSDSKEKDMFSVYPNPSSGNTVFNIDVEDIEGLNIVITDFQGKVIKILDVTSNQMNYKLGAIADGVYLVHLLKDETIQSTKKLIYAK